MNKILDLLLINEWRVWFITTVDHDEALAGEALLVKTAKRVALAFVGMFGVGALSMYMLLIGGSQATQSTPPGVSDSGTTINVPQSPGNTSALDICKNGVVTKGQTHIDGGSGNSMPDGYLAVLGPERVEYIDSPAGGKNLVVILNGQPQTVQPEVVKCLISRAK